MGNSKMASVVSTGILSYTLNSDRGISRGRD